MADGSRPDNAFAGVDDGVITAWPTKLALAPRLADEVERLISDVKPWGGDGAADWPHPDNAPLPWQEEGRWH